MAGLMSLRGLLPIIQPCDLHDFVFVHQAAVGLGIFFADDFDEFEKALQPGALDFRGLLGGLAFREQESGGGARSDRRAFPGRRREFSAACAPVPRRDHEFARAFRAAPSGRRASGRFLPANGRSCARRSRTGGYFCAPSRSGCGGCRRACSRTDSTRVMKSSMSFSKNTLFSHRVSSASIRSVLRRMGTRVQQPL